MLAPLGAVPQAVEVVKLHQKAIRGLSTLMERGKGNFGIWVGVCCAVPLAALAAVLLLNAPTLPVSLAAFAVLMLIAPRLLKGT